MLLDTLDNIRSIWTMGPPSMFLDSGDTVMYIDCIEKTNDGNEDIKYVVLHDGKVWATSGWFSKYGMIGYWKVKND